MEQPLNSQTPTTNLISITEGTTAESSDQSNSRTSSTSGVHSSSNSASSSHPQYTFGKDMWDCLSSLNESTTQRTFFMKSLRSFFSSYRKALDSFGTQMGKALGQYEKDFVRVKDHHVVDTLGTAMINIKMCLDEVLREVTSQSDFMLREMVDPLETYYKHYGQNSTELLKQGNQFWNLLHQERTAMLFAKENYYNQTQQAVQLSTQLLELKNQLAQLISQSNNQASPYFTHIQGFARKQQALQEEIASADRKYQQQQARADSAKGDYERSLSKLNSTIDQFETQYKPVLNRIQESDEFQINFVKSRLESLANSTEQLGRGLRDRGEEMRQAAAAVNSHTDLKIFVELHKSTNPFMQKEEFQVYENRFELVRETYAGQFDLNLSALQQNLSGVAANHHLLSNRSSSEISDSQLDSQKSNSTSGAGSFLGLNPMGGSGSFRLSTPKSAQREEQKRWQDGSQRLATEESYELLNTDQIEQDRLRVQELLVQLVQGNKPISLEEKGSLITLLQNKQMRSVLTEVLNEINSPKQLQNPESLKILADILKFVLTLFVHEQAQDFRLLYTIIESTQNMYCLANKRKQYLAAQLEDHDIWQDKRAWRECIQSIIAMKSEDASRRRKLSKGSNGGPADKEKGFFKKGLSSLKGLIASKEKPDKQTELKANQNLIFNELSRFVQSSINFSLSYEQANELLISFCEQFQLEQSRIHLLLTELQSNQKKTANMFTEKELLIWSLQRRGNRLKAFGFNEKTQILGITIRFLDSDRDLLSIMMLNKDIYELLGDEILEQALLHSSQHLLKQKRKQLWLKILKIDEAQVLQEFERNSSLIGQRLPKTVSDAIEVDVHRSFSNLRELLPASTLNRILKAYAITNPALDYCQGMNFIAGFLFLTMGSSEHLAYAVMKQVIDKFTMGNLFNQELPMLKLNFYQLDRLISIVLSDIHTHFKDETINSSYFSSPYFITLFTSVLQLQYNGENCEVLQRFWDYFIINGWKSVFKTSLIILKENEESLLQMPFEVMLTQIVNLPIKFFVAPDQQKEVADGGEGEEQVEDSSNAERDQEQREAVEKYDRLMRQMKIPTMLLERLKHEFDQNYKVSIQKSQTELNSNGGGS